MRNGIPVLWRHYYFNHFTVQKWQDEQRLYTLKGQTKCILHGESAMHDYLKSDIDSGCGSVSREDPMLLWTPIQVVPTLIVCDSPVQRRSDDQIMYWMKAKDARLKTSTLSIQSFKVQACQTSSLFFKHSDSSVGSCVIKHTDITVTRSKCYISEILKSALSKYFAKYY